MTDVKTYFRNENTTDTWLTPPEIVKSLGDFLLDPCSPIEAPWRLAPIYYTEHHDGLKQPWVGRVFMNPPYGEQCKFWMRKMVQHGDGVALVFARVETQWFHETVWNAADAVFFFDRRISFYRPNGTKGSGSSAPSCLVAYGQENVESLCQSGLKGKLIILGDKK